MFISSTRVERLSNMMDRVAASGASGAGGSGAKLFAIAAPRLGRVRLFRGSAAAAAPVAGAGRFLGGICPYTSPAERGERREEEKIAEYDEDAFSEVVG